MPDPNELSQDRQTRAAAEVQQFRRRQARGEAEELDEFLSKNEDLRELLEGFLGETVSLLTGETPSANGPIKPPEWIGGYRIIGILGEGGMGVVYLAEQLEPVQREVALKVIKLGMDTEDVLARFETERQALAMMNHPSIAKVYDAGVNEQGQPYFVMELVDGIPITDFCDLYNLSLKARIQVFQKLCLGVQHAHQKSVLHRDLKPANILVSLSDGQIVVKIIDFGLARATDRKAVERSLFTQQGRIIGTPAYMSPEQAEGRAQDIDTRTDVYSLGVLLYQLLTGEVPFRNLDPKRAGLLEMYRIIREEEPERPSSRISSDTELALTRASKRRLSTAALRKTLQGELDWIVMRALEKDPERRYDSAMALAVDLNHYLQGEPVNAGPGSGAYRLNRLIRKYRIHFVAGTLLFAVGLASAVLVWLYAIDAYRASVRADEEYTNAEGWRSEAMAQQARADRLEDTERQATADLQATTTRLQAHANAKALEARKHFERYEKLARAFDAKAQRNTFFTVDARRRQLRRQMRQLPSQPVMTAALERWLGQAHTLVDALPRLQLLRRNLELRRSGRRDKAYLDQLRKVNALQRADDLASHRIEFAATAILHDVASDVERSHAEGWPLVNPRRPAADHGQEGLGLALAQRVIELAGDRTNSRFHRTLAWALFANGQHGAALSASESALRLAGFDEKVNYRNDLQALRQAIEESPSTLAEAHTKLNRLDRAGPTRPSPATVATADATLHRSLITATADLSTWDGANGPLAEMQRRLTWARGITAWTNGHPNADQGASWSVARTAIRAADGRSASRLYARRPIDDLQPQLGLVPIGMNPDTGLWEFYHLASAWPAPAASPPGHLPIPTHGAAREPHRAGYLEPGDQSGMVFVLIPGGRLLLGRKAGTPLDLANADGSARDAVELRRLQRWFRNEVGEHVIDLEPFFLARHELTAGQLQRLSGLDQAPARGTPADPRLPVHSRSFDDLQRLLHRHDLAIPTEAQWEYACQAGQRQHWSTGNKSRDLRGHANLFDRSARDEYPNPGGLDPVAWSDGFAELARVGSFSGNAFGMHDMHGNVAEWCRDQFASYDQPALPGSGERRAGDAAPRVVRGGSYLDLPLTARTASRRAHQANFRSPSLGVRVSRALMH